MTCLPAHGRVRCARCFPESDGREFDSSTLTATNGGWRIKLNPLAWGAEEPEVLVLGFSKGPTQAGALVNEAHDEIAFKGGRTNVGKILEHLGVVERPHGMNYRAMVDQLISDPRGRFHFGSLVRCTVERFDERLNCWQGTGGGMLDKFVASEFGETITSNCAQQHLVGLPRSVKLVVMFGLGTRLNYVSASRKLLERALRASADQMSSVAYRIAGVTFVHVEHFASQGAHLPNWLGERDHNRSKLGLMARSAAKKALHG